MPEPSLSRGSPIPDSLLQFSADLARAVGLEGAVLVQQLKSVYLHQPATLRDGRGWLHVSHAYLLGLMPFWDLPQLLEICDRMEQVGLLQLDRDKAASGCLLLALTSNAETTAQPSAAAPARASARASADGRDPQEAGAGQALESQHNRRKLRSGEGEPLPPDFVPSEDMLELLERFHGVPRGFALAQLEDFTLYWRERGSAGHAWQNRFKQHVQWHWKRHQQERSGAAHGGEHEAGAARRTRDSSLEHDLTDTSWAD